MGFLSQSGHVGIATQLAKGTYKNPGAASVDAVHTITRTATSGDFTITVNGVVSGNITAAAGLTAGTIETALEAMSNIAPADIAVSGSAGGPYTLTWAAALADQRVVVSIQDVSLAGGTVTVAETTPGVSSGVFTYIRSGALGGNRELLVPDAEIGGNRDVPDAQLGPISFSGEYAFYPRMEAIACILRAALGEAVTTGTAALGYTHTITPADTVPWLSIEEKIGNGYEEFKYTDAKVTSLHLEAEATGYLMGTIGLAGLTQEIATPTAVADQRVDTSPLIVGSNVCVRWGGVELPAKSFSFDVNNNIETDDFRLCSMFLGDLTEKRRETTMSVTIRPEDSTLWRTAMWGGPTEVAPLGQSYKDDVEIEVTSYEDIPGATPGTKYSLVVTIPSAIIAPFSLNPSGDDVLQHDIEIRAVRPNPAVDLLTIAVKNSYPAIP